MKKIAIIGAGAAAERFIETVLSSSLKDSFNITAIFDDDVNKINSSIHGLSVTDTIEPVSYTHLTLPTKA